MNICLFDPRAVIQGSQDLFVCFRREYHTSNSAQLLIWMSGQRFSNLIAEMLWRWENLRWSESAQSKRNIQIQRINERKGCL